MKRYSREWITFHLKNNPLSQWLYSDRYITLYMITAQGPLRAAGAVDFALNNPDHIRCFQETESWHDYDAFTSAAAQSIATGGRLITAVADGILIYCCRMGYDTPQSRFTHVGQVIKFPPRTVAFFSAYTHPAYRGRGIGTAAVEFAVRTALGGGEQDQLIAVVDSNNIPAHRLHVSAGLEKVAVLRRRRFLGRETHTLENSGNRAGARLSAEGDAQWRLEVA